MHILLWQFWLIEQALSGEWMWHFWPFLKLQPPSFNWETPSLQPICHEIKRLHPILSNDLNNILSPISYHCTFRFHADWVDTFKRMNVELQTSKLNKNGSNWKVCTLSTMIRLSQVTLTSMLLWQSYESGQPNHP